MSEADPDRRGKASRAAPVARAFPCSCCGADQLFEIGQRALSCAYCGATRELDLETDAPIPEQDLLSELARLSELRDDPPAGSLAVEEVACDGCGAQLTFTSQIADVCAYCGSALVRAQAEGTRARPSIDGVLPFSVKSGAARRAVQKWQRSLWFAPNAFRQVRVPEALQRVYLPFWCFDALTFTRYHGERGTAYTVTERVNGQNRTRRKIRWRSVSGRFQHVFDDTPICADAALPKPVIEALEPWPTAKCVPFAPEVLAGAVTKTAEISLPEAFKLGKQRMQSDLEARARREIGGDAQRVHGLETRWDALAYKHLLFPVWLLTLRWKEDVFHLAVNAETGEVQGERPISWWKVGFAALGALVLVGLGLLARHAGGS